MDPAPKMTFPEFQDTRRKCSNLPAHFNDDGIESETGYTYLDGRYFIEITTSGSYYLMVDRSAYLSESLGEVERALYNWLVNEDIIIEKGQKPANISMDTREALEVAIAIMAEAIENKQGGEAFMRNAADAKTALKAILDQSGEFEGEHKLLTDFIDLAIYG